MASSAKKPKPKETINVAAAQKMLALLKTRHEENTALIDELERLLGGGPGIGEILKELYAYWIELWSQQHSGAYVFTFEKDAPQMKRLFRQLGLEELKARIFNYIKDNSDYVRNAKHPFSLFVATSNRYASAPQTEGVLGFAPVGCRHKPTCRTDQEHTKRVQQEVRS